MAFDRPAKEQEMPSESPAADTRNQAADQSGASFNRAATNHPERATESLREDEDAELLAALESRNRTTNADGSGEGVRRTDIRSAERARQADDGAGDPAVEEPRADSRPQEARDPDLSGRSARGWADRGDTQPDSEAVNCEDEAERGDGSQDHAATTGETANDGDDHDRAGIAAGESPGGGRESRLAHDAKDADATPVDQDRRSDHRTDDARQRDLSAEGNRGPDPQSRTMGPQDVPSEQGPPEAGRTVHDPGAKEGGSRAADADRSRSEQSGKGSGPAEAGRKAESRIDQFATGADSKPSERDLSPKARDTDPQDMVITIEVQKPPDQLPEDDDKKRPADKFRRAVNNNLDSILKETKDGVNVTRDILNPPPPSGRSETRVNDGPHIHQSPHGVPDVGGMVSGVVFAVALTAEWLARVWKKHTERDHQ